MTGPREWDRSFTCSGLVDEAVTVDPLAEAEAATTGGPTDAGAQSSVGVASTFGWTMRGHGEHWNGAKRRRHRSYVVATTRSDSGPETLRTLDALVARPRESRAAGDSTTLPTLLAGGAPQAVAGRAVNTNPSSQLSGSALDGTCISLARPFRGACTDPFSAEA